MTTATATIVQHVNDTLAAHLFEGRWTRRFVQPASDTIIKARALSIPRHQSRAWVMIFDAAPNGSDQAVPENSDGTIHQAFAHRNPWNLFRVTDFVDQYRGRNTIDVPWAALVNPAPQHDHWYREFDRHGNSMKLLRWHQGHEKFVVMAGASNEYVASVGQLLPMESVGVWFEIEEISFNHAVVVQEPAGQEPETPAADAPAEEEPFDFFGHAAPFTYGLDPIDGQLFVWRYPEDTDVAHLAIMDHGTPVGLGHWAKRYQDTYAENPHTVPPFEEIRYAAYKHTTTGLPEDMTWAQVELEVERTRDAAAQAFNDFDTQLGELAVEKECCGEYESIVVPLGLSPKPERNTDWWVRVNVRAEFSIGSPSGEVDSALSDEFGCLSLSSESMTFTSDVNFGFRVSDRASAENAEEHVDEDLVREELRDKLDGSGELEDIINWNVYSVDEFDENA